MASRKHSIRSRIVLLLAVPLTALLALWAVAAYTSLGDALLLLKAKALQDDLIRPTQALVQGLQEERRLSLAYLGGGIESGHTDLDRARAADDRLRADYRHSIGSGNLNGIQAPVLQRANALGSRLAEIDGLRPSIVSGEVSRSTVYQEFNSLIDGAFAIYDVVTPGNAEISLDARTLTTLGRARELIAREDALVTGVLASGSITPQERDDIALLVGAHRNLYADGVPLLRTRDQTGYNQLLTAPEMVALADFENSLMRSSGKKLPVTSQQWSGAAKPAQKELYDWENRVLADVTDRAQTIAIGVLLRLALTAGLGLVAVLVSIIIAVKMARRIIREARTLAAAVGTFSQDRLPQLAERVRAGEPIEETDALLDAGPFGLREINRLSEAFDAARVAVVGAARSEAAARKGVNELFINLARRNQALLHRQLGLLDTMERRAEQPGELDDLFKLDHLATCMRRHAEGLVILAGKGAGRTWRQPVPLVDVVRGAAAEVEDYTRVQVQAMPRAAIKGTAVADTIHLIAELIENATMFSPPDAPVQVGGQPVPNGFVLEVEDRGLGMSDELRTELNGRLAAAPEFDLFDSSRLGIFVVARLAHRHDIQVSLRSSPYGGTSAIIFLPAALLGEAPAEPDPKPAALPRPAPAAPEPADPDDGISSGTSPIRSQPTGQTHLGLPMRRRTSAAPPAPAPTPAPPQATVPAPAEEPAPARSPEEARSMMSAMQRGWQRGRDTVPEGGGLGPNEEDA